MSVRTKRATLVALALVLVAVAGSATIITLRDGGDDPRPPAAPASANGVTRVRLGQATPANAPGQVLYLEQVTIAPGAKLSPHYHEGTQVARVVSGVLTLNILSGTATITRGDGRTEEATGPRAVQLGPGETVIETSGLVHFGANDGTRPVVIELAALLAEGAPMATVTG